MTTPSGMRRRSLVLLVAALLPLAGPAAADSGPTSLAQAGLGRVLLDEAHGHLFVSGGPQGAGVRVVDLQGGLVATLDLPGAVGMALTRDAGSLWVAQPTGMLTRVDTSSLAVAQRIALPTGQCPGDVAISDSRLVYGWSCVGYLGSGPSGGLGVLDPATGDSYGTVTTGPSYRPVVATGPAGQVYAADAGANTTALSLYDVRGASPQLVASRVEACSGLRDLNASPDGSRVATACGYPYSHAVWSADKLTSLDAYPSGAYPVAGAWSADGATFVAGLDAADEPDVITYGGGGQTPGRIVDFGPGELLQARGLAVSGDGSRAWAVTRTAPGGLALRVLDLVGSTPTALTLAADPPTVATGSSTSIGGRLTSSGTGVAGAVLRVERTSTGAAPVGLPSVTTRADGTFVVADSPPASATYTVSWPGDGTLAPATASAQVVVDPALTALRLTLSRGTTSAGSVSGVVLLSWSGGDSLAGRTVRLSRAAGGLVTTLPSLTTDPNGGAKFLDSPPAGAVTYTATFDGVPGHAAATATATIDVLAPSALTTSAPASTLAGDPVRLTGRLTSSGTGLAGRQVVVSRSGCGSTNWSGSTPTGTDGAWSLSDPFAPVGTCGYLASYAGGGGYGSSTATTSATVVLRPADLSLSVVRGTGSTKKHAYVTGHLGAWHTNRSVVLTAQPAGGVEVTLASGPVDAAGDLRATYTPPAKGTVTYRVRYAGDDWYRAAVVERVQ